jgi:DNA recombination protein RmuC
MTFGAVVGWLIAAARGRAQIERARSESREQVSAESLRAEIELTRRREAERERDEVRSARDDLDRRLSAAGVEIRKTRELVDEQKMFIAQSRKDFEDSFKALAGDALRGSTVQFLELAEQRWKTTREEAAADLDKRRQNIETLLEPLKLTLKNLDEKTGRIEEKREGATADLQNKTTSLDTALRGTQVRGRWGEIALRNIAEFAGMSEHCDFVEQETTDDGKRPDMIVRIPEGRFIAVDSKVPLSGYLRAAEATDDATRKAGLREHVQAVRHHIRTLAARDYAAGIEGDVDLVVLFLPGDSFLAAAFSEEPELQVEALRSRVLLATPTTLVALLRTVAIYYQQRSLADNAREIADTARELYDRAAKFGDDLARAGRGLKTAVDAYNAAVGSFERRFLPMGQKLENLKVTEQSRRELGAPPALTEGPRGTPSRDELEPSSSTEAGADRGES